jgi:hypothetical protein
LRVVERREEPVDGGAEVFLRARLPRLRDGLDERAVPIDRPRRDMRMEQLRLPPQAADGRQPFHLEQIRHDVLSPKLTAAARPRQMDAVTLTSSMRKSQFCASAATRDTYRCCQVKSLPCSARCRRNASAWFVGLFASAVGDVQALAKERNALGF